MNCTQCGRCCYEEICSIGEEILQRISSWLEINPPCPFLRYENDKAWCGLLFWAKIVSEECYDSIAKALAIGKGCDAERLEEADAPFCTCEKCQKRREKYGTTL